jgi:hypothetical protein
VLLLDIYPGLSPAFESGFMHLLIITLQEKEESPNLYLQGSISFHNIQQRSPTHLSCHRQLHTPRPPISCLHLASI